MERDPLHKVYSLWTACLCSVYFNTGVRPEELLPFRRCRCADAKKILCNLWMLNPILVEGLTSADWLEKIAEVSLRTIMRYFNEPGGSPSCVGWWEARAVLRNLSPADVHVAIAAGWFGSGRIHAKSWQEAGRLLERSQGWIRAECPPGSLSAFARAGCTDPRKS